MFYMSLKSSEAKSCDWEIMTEAWKSRLRWWQHRHSLTRWLYHHARWLYKHLSSYMYEWNCTIEELTDEVDAFIIQLEEQQKINQVIKNKSY
jgi:hypothetical protein